MGGAWPGGRLPLRLPDDATGMPVENEGYGLFQYRTGRATSRPAMRVEEDAGKTAMTHHGATGAHRWHDFPVPSGQKTA
ncbi:MAG: hypothetical protein HQM04_11525 [Magnetococcales bacterium]|nr:hypothetical protein [Magnetococcales bacterium]